MVRGVLLQRVDLIGEHVDAASKLTLRILYRHQLGGQSFGGQLFIRGVRSVVPRGASFGLHELLPAVLSADRNEHRRYGYIARSAGPVYPTCRRGTYRGTG